MAPIRLCPLLGSEDRHHEHVDPAGYGPRSLVRDNHFIDQNLGIPRLHRSSSMLQDLDANVVGPVVENLSEVVAAGT